MPLNKIPILMYHSVEYMPKNTVMRSLHVPPGKFRFQMLMLKILGYQALSIRNLRPYLTGEKQGKVVGITFDDGYQNNLLNAAPVLKQFNFSATCYIVSEHLGASNIWDIEKGVTQRPLMTANEIKKWLDLGMDIGSHTKSHYDLTKISKNAIKEEVNGSKDDLEKTFNVRVIDFCYPFGSINEEIVRIVKKAGYFSGTSMQRGRASEASDIMSLPRIPINHRTPFYLFLLKILTKYEDKRS